VSAGRNGENDMSRRNSQADAKIALPIAPMLDMTFQLLFFFIMNFNPADLEGQMEAALPAPVREVGEMVAAPQAPALPAGLTVEVRAGIRGGISALSLRGADGRAVPLDGLDALGTRLADMPASMREGVLRISADARLSVEHLMRVIDTCKAAGFANTALVAPE
jgi:biopolymer transport protein ExbD